VFTILDQLFDSAVDLGLAGDALATRRGASGSCSAPPHDLKHSGVAFLAAAGVDPSEIARRAGHASVAFTYDRYGHLLPEVDKQAATKLEAVRAATRLA
jgi:integrase